MKRSDLAAWLVAGCILLAGAAYLGNRSVLDEPDALFTTIGSVQYVGESPNSGVIEFRFSPEDITYLVASGDPQVQAAVRGSFDSGNGVTIKAHLRGAGFVGSTAHSEFWVESFEYLGRRYGPFDTRMRWSWRSMPHADAALLHGIAADANRRYPEAVLAFTEALNGGLNGARTARAFAGRADAFESQTYPIGRAINSRDDDLLVLATADYRRAAELNRDDPRILISAAYALRELGAYPEALALYDDAERRFPDAYFRIAITRGSAWRQLGRYEDALHALDELVAKHGEQDGMMYHYHRALTLIRLDRNADAVREASAGIEDQPDYGWAFVARACAHARLGETDASHADLDAAQHQFEQDHAAFPSADNSDIPGRVRGAREDAAPEASCGLLGTGPGERRRERSARLK